MRKKIGVLMVIVSVFIGMTIPSFASSTSRLPNGDYEGYPGTKPYANTIYRLSALKGNRILIAGEFFCDFSSDIIHYSRRTRVFKLSSHPKFKNYARWANNYKGGTYTMTKSRMCWAYKHENDMMMHVYFHVKNNRVTKIAIESSFKL